jgi:hypothetical protein
MSFAKLAAEIWRDYFTDGDVASGAWKPSKTQIRAWALAVENAVGAGLVGTATYNPASLNDGAGVTTTVTVTGAALGDIAHASFSLDLQGVMLTAWVSAANTVSVRFQNESGGTLDLASGTLKAVVCKVS